MKYLFVFLLVGLMVSCGNDANKKYQIPQKVNRYPLDSVELSEKSNKVILKSTKQPVTGIVFENHSNGQNSSIENFRNGEWEGTQTYWYEDGQMDKKLHYKSGQKDGMQFYWYSDGQNSSIENFRNGEWEGTQTYWYEDGTKQLEVKYKNGKQNGISKKWYKNGQLEVETSWTDGKSDGKVDRGWFENGQLKYQGGKGWYSNGALRYETKMEGGKIIFSKCWDVDGNVIECP